MMIRAGSDCTAQPSPCVTDVLGGHLVDVYPVVGHLIGVGQGPQRSFDQLLLRFLAEPRRAFNECNWHFVSPRSGTASSIAATYSKDDPREQKDSVERKNFMPVSTEDGTELRALRKPVPGAGTLLPAEPSIPGRASLRVIRCWQRGHFMQHVRGVR